MSSRILVCGILCLGGLVIQACQGHGDAAVKDPGVAETKADTGPHPRLVVKDFTANGVAVEEISGLTGKFCTEVFKCKKIDLICADDLRVIMQHNQDLISLGTCEQEDCLARMAKALQANFIVQGSVSKVGETFLINLILVNADTATATNRFSQEVASGKPEDLLDAMTQLAEKLQADFK